MGITSIMGGIQTKRFFKRLEFDHINDSKIDYYKARQIFSKEKQAEEYVNLFKKFFDENNHNNSIFK
ncbi:MAG: hypothetical protein CM15mP23_21190 [Cryomorphaceae bacterium]|nr:MAG: hypothetical protein CM15mP23_21190 [Cryomorphaceae bacterium]